MLQAHLRVKVATLGIDRDCEVEIHFEGVGRASEVDMRCTGLTMEAMNALLTTEAFDVFDGVSAEGSSQDGRHLQVILGPVAGVSPASMESAVVKCHVRSATFSEVDQSPANEDGEWVCDVANLRLAIGDAVSPVGRVSKERGGRRGDGGWARDLIAFTLEGREWLVKIGMKEEDVAARVRGGPLVTAVLKSKVRAHDNADKIWEQAADIARLLSFATSRAVRVCCLMQFTDGGVMRSRASRHQWLPGMDRHGHVHIDQWEIGVVRSFLEAAYVALKSDYEWLSASLDLYLQASLAEFIEVRLALLNILLDRIQAHVLSDELPPQIDPRLEEHFEAGGLEERLHDMLTSVIAGWDELRTAELVRTIKTWNSSLSFPGAIHAAAKQLGISAPAKKLLGHRHKLLHVAEIPPLDEAMGYLEELDACCLLFLLRLLGYDGVFHHDKFGADPTTVSAILGGEAS